MPLDFENFDIVTVEQEEHIPILSGDRTESNEWSNCSNRVCVVVCSTNIALPSV